MHCGAVLYIGQIVSGGRVEVVALGPEVGECATIQSQAASGQILASSALVDQLGEDDAARLGLMPSTLRYRSARMSLDVADLPMG